jgi:hypothetical protein
MLLSMLCTILVKLRCNKKERVIITLLLMFCISRFPLILKKTGFIVAFDHGTCASLYIIPPFSAAAV